MSLRALTDTVALSGLGEGVISRGEARGLEALAAVGALTEVAAVLEVGFASAGFVAGSTCVAVIVFAAVLIWVDVGSGNTFAAAAAVVV